MNKSTELYKLEGNDPNTLRVLYDLHRLLCESDLSFHAGMSVLFGTMDEKELRKLVNECDRRFWTPARKRNLLGFIASMRSNTPAKKQIRYARICDLLMRLIRLDDSLGGVTSAPLYEAFCSDFTGRREFWFMPIPAFNPGSVFRVGLSMSFNRFNKSNHVFQLHVTNGCTETIIDTDSVSFGAVIQRMRTHLVDLLNQNITIEHINQVANLIRHVAEHGNDDQRKVLHDNGITI